jgi:hypothetical protein
MKRSLPPYGAALLLSLTIFGCRSSTEPLIATSNGNSSHPAVGSSYSYLSTARDSTGVVIDDHEYTQSVTAVNVALGGRTDATQLVDADAADTTYYAIQTNNDVLVYMGDPTGMSSAADIWVKLPFSGGAGVTMPMMDTTADIFGMGIPVHIVMTMTTKAAGSELVGTAGKTFNARKATMTVSMQMSLAGQTSTTTILQNFWYAPEIGNFVKMEQPTYIDGMSSAKSDSRVDVLSAYTLK